MLLATLKRGPVTTTPVVGTQVPEFTGNQVLGNPNNHCGKSNSELKLNRNRKDGSPGISSCYSPKRVAIYPTHALFFPTTGNNGDRYIRHSAFGEENLQLPTNG